MPAPVCLFQISGGWYRPLYPGDQPKLIVFLTFTFVSQFIQGLTRYLFLLMRLIAWISGNKSLAEDGKERPPRAIPYPNSGMEHVWTMRSINFKRSGRFHSCETIEEQ
jgi:hypothetical protein